MILKKTGKPQTSICLERERKTTYCSRIAAKSNPIFEVNVYMRKAQPKDLDASEIDVRLGATWIDKNYIQQIDVLTF